jgi:hypothetical protein
LPAQLPAVLDRALRLAGVDFAPARRQPAAIRVVAALILAVIGSLAADALLAAVGMALFPSTRDFPHFQFADYARLTIAGVVIACVVQIATASPAARDYRSALLDARPPADDPDRYAGREG